MRRWVAARWSGMSAPVRTVAVGVGVTIIGTSLLGIWAWLFQSSPAPPLPELFVAWLPEDGSAISENVADRQALISIGVVEVQVDRVYSVRPLVLPDEDYEKLYTPDMIFAPDAPCCRVQD